MDLLFLRENIIEKVTVIKSRNDIVEWLNVNNLSINNSNKQEICNKYNEYLKCELEKRIDDITKYIGVYSFNFDLTYRTISNRTDGYEKKAAIAGGLAGGGLILLLEGMLGPIGLLAAGLSALGGYLFGQSRVQDKVIDELYNSTVNAQNKICEEIRKIITNIINKEIQIVDYKTKIYDKPLSNEQQKIKDFISNRNIKYLVHFTNIKNVGSIKKYGLLSRNIMDHSKIDYLRNDPNRFDNYLDAISLSITHINENLYNKFRYDNSLSNYTIIKINPALLWMESNRRLYCQTNAATTFGKKGESYNDFEKMFDDYVAYNNTSGFHEYDRKHLANNEATDTQAEILWFDTVPREYLLFDDDINTNKIMIDMNEYDVETDDDLPF